MIFSYAATDNKALHLQYSKLLETRMEVAKKQLEEAEDRAAIAFLSMSLRTPRPTSIARAML